MSTIPNGNLIFAVPKKGRLYERVLLLLKGAGISFRRKARIDIANSTNMPISLLFLNVSDIAVFVAKGSVDLGITGEDMIAESQSIVKVELKLNMGQCKLALQAPLAVCSKGPAFFAGLRIATSFPTLTKAYFDKIDGQPEVQYISGSVEAACGLGLADAVVDLVETGTTMQAAGLGIVECLLTTETVLVSNPNSKHMALILQIRNRIAGWMMSTLYSMVTYNIIKSKIEQASVITPGIQAPTIIELSQSGWVAIQAMVKSEKVPQKMEELCQLGATGIIATAVSNCRMD